MKRTDTAEPPITEPAVVEITESSVSQVGTFEVRRALPRRTRRRGPPRLDDRHHQIRPRRLAPAAPRRRLTTLDPTMTDHELMPAAFIGHGSPMNAPLGADSCWLFATSGSRRSCLTQS